MEKKIKELDTRFQIITIILILIIMTLTWHVSENSKRIGVLERQLEPKDSTVIRWEKTREELKQFLKELEDEGHI